MGFASTQAAIQAAISHGPEPIEEEFPTEFRDGARSGFLQQREAPRDPGGYPRGFNRWPLKRRNAWFAGFNVGFHDRLRLCSSKATL
jgi:hypothetical protein